jgi:hypothetical protein
MQANLLTDFRKPTPIEEALLNRLLDADFPGKADLALLLRDLLVRTLDEDGGLALRSKIEGGHRPCRGSRLKRRAKTKMA